MMLVLYFYTLLSKGCGCMAKWTPFDRRHRGDFTPSASKTLAVDEYKNHSFSA